MARIGGIVYVRLERRLIPVGEGELTYSTGGFKRDAVLTSHGVAGFIEKAKAPFIEFEGIDTDEVDFEKIKKTDKATVTAELNNGKTIVLHDAWYAGEGEGTSEGKLKMRFEAKRGETL